jgi:hypothetical protein
LFDDILKSPLDDVIKPREDRGTRTVMMLIVNELPAT